MEHDRRVVGYDSSCMDYVYVLLL